MLSCIQVLIFGVLAIEVKNKAPNAHTFLEMVDVRWGRAAHVTFLFFGFTIYSLWASVALVWGWLAAVVIIGLPLYENKETIANVLHWKTAEAANVTMTRTDPGAGSETSKV